MGACTSTVEALEVCLFYVMTLYGQSFTVFVKKPYAEITYYDIKVALYKLEGFPVHNQHLILTGKGMPNCRLVKDDNVNITTCLHLVGVNIEKN